MAYEDGEASEVDGEDETTASPTLGSGRTWFLLVGFGVGVAATSFACSEW